MEKGWKPDDGYYFGLGVFETIAVEENCPIFLNEHLERLMNGMDTLGLDGEIKPEQVYEWLDKHPVSHGALKITVSKENTLWEIRKNPYTEDQYRRGFTADFSRVRRNSTSVFTYLKSLNYGDCILEKRKARECGIDEPIFLNEYGEICEGAVSNIFCVKKDGRVLTPKVSCGLLPGTIRRVLLENGMAEESVIAPADLDSFQEIFLTNSLMGIMPVRKLERFIYREQQVTNRLRDWLNEFSKNL